MIFNIVHEANWEFIKNRKQLLNQKNTNQENKKRINYNFTQGEEVLLRKGTENKYERPYEGPYKVVKTYTNGTVKLLMGAVTDRVNIRRITPFKRKRKINLGGECSEACHTKRKKN